VFQGKEEYDVTMRFINSLLLQTAFGGLLFIPKFLTEERKLNASEMIFPAFT